MRAFRIEAEGKVGRGSVVDIPLDALDEGEVDLPPSRADYDLCNTTLAVAAAGWVGLSSPGDYATFEFLPPSRHDQCCELCDTTLDNRLIGIPNW